ncbi:hypothetical protein EAF00_008928 [Botryotinia globosa]|nr:hypothetical protein EAF00_008928 [Botryotinia globosa]
MTTALLHNVLNVNDDSKRSLMAVQNLQIMKAKLFIFCPRIPISTLTKAIQMHIPPKRECPAQRRISSPLVVFKIGEWPTT